MVPEVLHRLGTRAWRRGLIALIVGVQSACTSLGPFEGPQPNADERALCYSSAATTPDQLRTTARDACGGGAAQFLHQETNLSACPLLTPIRLNFTCSAG